MTTLAPTGATKTTVVSTDVVAGSRFFDNPKFASTATGGALVVWGHNADNDTATTGDVQARVFNSSGAAAAAEFNLSTATGGGEGTVSVTRLGNGNFLTIWSDTLATSGLTVNTNIMGRIVTAAGTPTGSEFTINSNVAGLQLGSDLETLGNGNAVAVWATGSLTFSSFAPTGIQGRFISSAGAPTGAEFSVDTISGGTYEERTLDIVTLGNGGFAVFWSRPSVRLRRSTSSASMRSGARQGSKPSSSPPAAIATF